MPNYKEEHLNFLYRVKFRFYFQDERSFTEEEEEKLQVAFELNKDEIEAVLDTLSFILEQAAYHCAKPAILQQQLAAIELNEEKVSCNCILELGFNSSMVND